MQAWFDALRTRKEQTKMRAIRSSGSMIAATTDSGGKRRVDIPTDMWAWTCLQAEGQRLRMTDKGPKEDACNVADCAGSPGV